MLEVGSAQKTQTFRLSKCRKKLVQIKKDSALRIMLSLLLVPGAEILLLLCIEVQIDLIA